MVFGVLQGTGVTVKADTGSTESNTITVNADCLGRQISDTDVSQRIIQTLDAMIEAGSENILLVTEGENFKTYLIGIDRSITSDLYDFMIYYDKTDKTVSVSCSQNWSVDEFESTLDCSAVGQEGCYSSITFYTYVFVYLMVNFETGTNTYFSKDIDGSKYTMDDDYYPTQNGEEPYIIPYKGTLEDIVGSEFVCFPEITREGKKYYSWHLVDEYTEPEDWEIVNINTSFTEFENALAVSFDEPAHNYPESTDTANDYVIWNWGTADNDYKDTYVEILCTDSDCPEEDKGVIRIQNTADITNLVNVTKEVVDTTCTIDGKTIYTATVNYVENGTTYTYTATKTVNGENATGHNWVFDTLDANAVWNDDNTTVTIKKTCTDTYHNSEKDGDVELNVSSSDISDENIPASKCGETSKTVYTATFDSSIDAAIETPFTITKTVNGTTLQHDWVFDTAPANVKWNDDYTKATITKTCKNSVHEGESIKISSTSIAKETDPATACGEVSKTTYTATFNSSVDSDIVTPFTVSKTVAGEILQHNWVIDTNSNNEIIVIWDGSDADGYTKATITKTCTNAQHDAQEGITTPITVDVKRAEVEGDTHYTATFDSSMDSSITDTLIFEKVVKADVHQHDWKFDTSEPELTQDDSGRYILTIKKTCNKDGHVGDVTVPASSNNVTVSTGPAIKCGEPTKIFYTATFDSEVDPCIAEKFTVTIEKKGDILQHNWVFETDPEKVSWVEGGENGYSEAIIIKKCTNSEHDGIEVICTSKKIAVSKESAKECGDSSKTIYTATFDSEADSDITEAFTVQKVVEGPVLQHNWEYDTTNVVWATGNTSATITKKCTNAGHGEQSNAIPVSSSKITISSENATTCGAIGTVRYTATFDSTVDPDIKSSFSVYKEVENTKLLHNWQVDSYISNASYAVKPDEVTIYVVCGRNNLHTETIVTNNITEAPGTDEVQKTYVYTGKTVDGQIVTVSEIVYSHKSHAWDVIFTWEAVDVNKVLTKAVANATCSIGGEKKALDVTLTDKVVGRYIEYSAKATDPSGKEWTDYRTINTETKEVKKGKVSPEINNGGFTLEGLEEEYKYTGAPIKPAFSVVDNATETTLANGTDYSVSFSNNTKVGVATVKVKGKGNYNKSNAEATFKIVNPKDGMDEADLADLKGAKITAVTPKAFEYDGEAHYPETITLKLKGGSEVVYTGTDGENYVDAEGNALPAAVSFSGNVNKGTATVLLSGKSNAKGKATTVKKTFKINAVDLKQASADDLTVTVVDETVAWEVKGAQPKVKVEYKGRELLAGQDYKVTYKNNKKVGTATVTIAGKGNYAKTRKDAASFTIEAFDLSDAKIIATTAAAGVKVTKVKVTILDKAGNVIPAGKLTVTVEGAAGAKLAAGENVTVKASAKGAELKEFCTEEVTVQAGDLSKAKIKVGVKKTYTGEPIELTDDDMKLVTVTVAGATLVYGEDFKITGYSNNIKKGSMVVTIVGKGEKYSGSKTFKVKIEPKPIGSGK